MQHFIDTFIAILPFTITCSIIFLVAEKVFKRKLSILERTALLVVILPTLSFALKEIVAIYSH